MRFKEFMIEKAMNAKTFGEVGSRLATVAKVGFEFEFLVPEDTTLYADSDNTSQPLSDYDSLDDYEEHFGLSASLRRAIMRDYEDWVASHDDPGENTDFNEWIDLEFGNRKKFVDAYGLEPHHGWQDTSERRPRIFVEPPQPNDQEIADNVAQSLKKIGIEPKVHDSYHGGDKNTKNWYLEPDGSINGVGHGLELVSPPLELAAARSTVKKIFSWMQSNDLQTNATTGLHINISVPDIAEKLDPVKLVLFMGEDYARAVFGRKGSTFTNSQSEFIMQSVKKSGVIPSTEKDMRDTAFKYLSQTKHFTANLGHLSAGYIEFRVAGGKDYEKDTDKVDKMILRLVTAVDLACRPEEERTTYLKKLAALFAKTDDQILSVTKGDRHKLPIELRRLYKYTPEIMSAWNLYKDKSGIDSTGRTALLNLLMQSYRTVKNFNTSIDLKERVFFKRLMKDVSLHTSDIDDYFGNNTTDRLRFKKEFGI